MKDTVKPYKGNLMPLRDLAFLLIGLDNIVTSFFSLTLSALYLAKLPYSLFAGTFKDDLKLTGTIFGVGAISLAHGLFRIAFAPIALLRIPFRAVVTMIQGKPMLEDSDKLRRLATQRPDESGGSLNDMLNMTAAMMKTFDAARERGQPMRPETRAALNAEQKQDNAITAMVMGMRTRFHTLQNILNTAIARRDAEKQAPTEARRVPAPSGR